MKTYIVMEINENKAVLLSSDGEIVQANKKAGWRVGDTVQYKKKSKNAKYMMAIAASLLLVLGIGISPLVQGGSDRAVDVASVDVETETPKMPTLVPQVTDGKIEVADNKYHNIFEEVGHEGIGYGELGLSPSYYSDASASDSDTSTSESDASPSQSDVSPSNSDAGMPSSESNIAAESSTKNVQDVSSESNENKDYSKTNIQTKGVQEADIVITDGDYIYGINNKSLYIVAENSSKPVVTARIPQKENSSEKIAEMYVSGDKLIAFRQVLAKSRTSESDNNSGSNDSTEKSDGSDNADSDNTSCDVQYLGNVDTEILIYDISKKNKPKLVKTMKQSGEYSDSRLIADKLYLVTSYLPNYSDNLDKDKPKTYLPLFYDGNNVSYSRPDDVALINKGGREEFTVVSGIDISSNPKFISKKSFAGNSYDVYCSQDNMYLYTYSYSGMKKSGNIETSYDETKIIKLELRDGEIETKQSIKVPGSILNQFSMDEHEGVLRVVTTVSWDSYTYVDNESDEEDWGEYNALYTFNENMKPLGKIENIAPDEMLHSARFMGDTGYFVTFKQVDPLFTVDLKNPGNPRIVGELKIPGFSDYLHPYSDGRLLGVGNDADSKTGAVGDIKLSMFDNSNPTNVKEKHTLIVKGQSYTEVANNHKAILVDEEKGIVGFPTDGTYFIFTYDDADGFKEEVRLKIPSIDVDEEDNSVDYDSTNDTDVYVEVDAVYPVRHEYEYNQRGLFIGDTLYVTSPDRLTYFNMKQDFKKIGELKLD